MILDRSLGQKGPWSLVLTMDSSRQQGAASELRRYDGPVPTAGSSGPGGARAAAGVRLVDVVTDDEPAAAWLACGVVSTSVRQRRTTASPALTYGEAPLV